MCARLCSMFRLMVCKCTRITIGRLAAYVQSDVESLLQISSGCHFVGGRLTEAQMAEPKPSPRPGQCNSVRHDALR